MSSHRKSTKRVVRVVSPIAFRHMDHKVNREKKHAKALRHMRPERDND